MDEGGRATKRKRFSEGKITGVLKEAEAGAKVDDICRRHGVSSAAFHSSRKKYADTCLFRVNHVVCAWERNVSPNINSAADKQQAIVRTVFQNVQRGR